MRMNFLQIRIHERIPGKDAACWTRCQNFIPGPISDTVHDRTSCQVGRVMPKKPAHTQQTYLRTACPTGSRNPASLASPSALSVASHVKSGSVRPKCPYAAVVL